MAIDIFIPVGEINGWNYEDLRFSLRSLEKFGRNVGKIIVCGVRPDWLQNVEFIPHTDNHKLNHERRINEKILQACNSSLISENFLMWNDDFFLTQEIDCEKYPYYHMGKLIDAIARRRMDPYRESIHNTYKALVEKGFQTNHFDCHCPIIYNKAAFKQMSEDLNWNTRNGFIIKSLYANSQFVPAQHMADLKIAIRPVAESEILLRIKGRHIFSIGDSALNDVMKNFIMKSYPNKSKYEK